VPPLGIAQPVRRSRENPALRSFQNDRPSSEVLPDLSQPKSLYFRVSKSYSEGLRVSALYRFFYC